MIELTRERKREEWRLQYKRNLQTAYRWWRAISVSNYLRSKWSLI